MRTIFGKNIVVDQNILGGKPIIKGTRIPVELILKKMSQNIPTEEILKDYPRLKKAHIQEILSYSHFLISKEEVYPV